MEKYAIIDETREFDLNIEKILENWEVYHAIREIIANAIDEQIITNTQQIQIIKTDDNCWHVIDYGRGINYSHLTQNENIEKLNNPKLIGKFGIGLKDALATLHRNNIIVRITSRYGAIELKEVAKNGFNDIITLHAVISPPSDPNMIGTDFCLFGCLDEDIEKAKSLFLAFSNEKILEKTKIGYIIENNKGCANIYINGVKVAEEENFLFSYNITSLTSKIKKELNRERTNVGRTAYTDRIKDILLSCSNEQVIKTFCLDLNSYGSGLIHDELNWKNVQLYFSKQLNNINNKVVFVSRDDYDNNVESLDELKMDGYEPVFVSKEIIESMNDQNSNNTDITPFSTVQQYLNDKKKNFEPIIIDFDKLTIKEIQVYEKTEKILELIGGKPKNVNNIFITEKLYKDDNSFKTLGLWNPEKNTIYILRTQLNSISDYAGTLLHECVHAISGADDITRSFENQLTNLIGCLVNKIVE